MNIIDICIVLLILMGAVVGFKQGGIKTLTTFIGLILIFAISWAFKSKLATYLYEGLPFFNFGGSFRGIQALNILLYELIAFMIIFALLSFIYRILLVVTGLIEKVLKATIFLSIPSKILGIFVGALETYSYIFIALVFLTLPFFNITLIKESKYANYIVNNTLYFSNISEKMVTTYNDVYNIVQEKDEKNNEQLNQDIVVIYLKNGIITPDNLQKLIDKKKIVITDESVLEEYR